MDISFGQWDLYFVVMTRIQVSPFKNVSDNLIIFIWPLGEINNFEGSGIFLPF